MQDTIETTTPSRPDWWRLGPGLVMLLTPLAIAIISFDAVRFSHPAYAILLSLTGTLGALFIARGLRPSTPRTRRRRIVSRTLVVLLAVVLGAITWTLRPAEATDVAVAALEDGPDVTVTQSATRIEMRPVGTTRTSSLVFYPGGLVEPRAYANILRPIAAAGYPVTVVKPPFGLAIFAPGAAAAIAGPGDVVAGHSLGGVVAASSLEDEAGFAGLVLWASFPAASIADRPEAVISIYGTEDGLTTMAQVAESRPDLPASTTFVEVSGAVHAHFGDYGDQQGDGTPTTSRADAQSQIVAATLALLESIDAAAP